MENLWPLLAFFWCLRLVVGYEAAPKDNPLSNVDCSFDHLAGSEDSGFCRWRPDQDGSLLWHTGNAVLVGSSLFVDY